MTIDSHIRAAVLGLALATAAAAQDDVLTLDRAIEIAEAGNHEMTAPFLPPGSCRPRHGHLDDPPASQDREVALR